MRPHTLTTKFFKIERIINMKNNLLTGDMLVHKNGKVSTVMLNTKCGNITRFHTSFNSFSYLDNFNDDLSHVKHDGLSVVSIYRTFNPDPTKVGDAIANPDKMLTRSNLIWTAEPENIDDNDGVETTGKVALTVADIEKILGHKVAIIGIDVTGNNDDDSDDDYDEEDEDEDKNDDGCCCNGFDRMMSLGAMILGLGR